MYDSISSNVWRLGRRRWYLVVLCALLGAGAGLALGSVGGADVSGRFDIRVATLDDLASILDVAKGDDVSLSQAAAQAALDFELSDESNVVTATFVGNDAARTLRVSIVGDDEAAIDTAAGTINESVKNLVVTPRLDQVAAATTAIDNQIELLTKQRTDLDESIDALAIDDPLRPTLLLQRAGIDRDITSTQTDRGNLAAYGEFVETNLLSTDTTKYTSLSQGFIGVIAGAMVGAILALLGFVVVVLLDHRVRRRIHLEQAAPGREVLTVSAPVDKMTEPEQAAFQAAAEAFVEHHELTRLVVVDQFSELGLESLLDADAGYVVVFSDAALPSPDEDGRTGYLLVARWGRSSQDHVSAAVASLDSAGSVPVGVVLVDVPRGSRLGGCEFIGSTVRGIVSVPNGPTPDTVCVVGLGKIGLPLAVQFATRGLDVVGADISAPTVDLVNAGVEPFPGEADLDRQLAAVIASGALRATTDTAAAVARSRVVVVVVPLIVDARGTADFGALDAATRAIGSALTPGSIVLYETTVPVGTTRTRFAPALASESGLVCGEDFHVAFSPERVYSGRIFADLKRYPKLIGGLDQQGSDLASAFYERALEFDPRTDLARPNGVWDLGSAEAAELAKLAETTYRDINIAFANELAAFSEGAGIDVFEVIEASNSQPFSHIHQPGIAVGGHCIPVYPRLFLMNAPDARVPAAARDANEAVPARVVGRLDDACGGLHDKHVVVFGAAYRGGVKETAFSGVFSLVSELLARGASVSVHDPLYSDDELRGLGFEPFALGQRADAAVIQADHAQYRTMWPHDVPGIRVILDGRHCTTPSVWNAAGVTHLQLGTAMASSLTSDDAVVDAR